MPRSAPTSPQTKRKREPFLEDVEGGIAITANIAHAADAPSQRKRPRRAGALIAKVKVEAKEEGVDIIPPEAAPAAAEPEPGPKLEPKAKVEAKPEPRSSEAGPSRVPARRVRRTASTRPSTARPSPAPIPRGEVERQDGVPIPSQSPSKAAKKAKGPSTSRAVKRARLERWRKWCDDRKWISQDDPSYKQVVGDIVAHRTDAMTYYRFKGYEIDTIPYVAFDNVYNQKSFGRAYDNSSLRTLVSRKWAYLAGLDEQEQFDPKMKEAEFLKEGWKLFEADKRKWEEAMKKSNKLRKPLKLWEVVPPPAGNSREEPSVWLLVEARV